MSESHPKGKDDKDVKLSQASDDGCPQQVVRGEFISTLLQEARAVSFFCFTAMAFRLVVTLVILLGDDDYVENQLQYAWPVQWLADWIPNDQLAAILLAINRIAKWHSTLIPGKVHTGQAPGFFFANPWILFWVQKETGVIANLPLRLSEIVNGTLSPSMMLAVLPIHLVCTISTAVVFQKLFSEQFAAVALDPVEYVDSIHGWVDFTIETLLSSILTSFVILLPGLFARIRAPKFLIAFLLYPVFNCGVDGEGGGTSFAPNILLALCLLNHSPLPSFVRIAGPLFGGLLGGLIVAIANRISRPKEESSDCSTTTTISK